MVLIAEVEDRRIKKPFLGGWRHTITGVEYLNAASQSGPLTITMKRKGTCSRLVQSVETKDANTQSPCNRATQMWRRDCYITSETDKYATVRQYETYEEMQQRLNLDGKARIIQRNYRIYRLLKYIKESAKKYRDILDDCKKYEEEKLMLIRKRHEEELIRMTYPLSRSDFDMLYDVIEKWRDARFESTKSRYFKAARCSENLLILEKSVEMLNVLGRKKRLLRDEYRRRKRVKFITFNCRPIRWNGYKGKLVEMISLKTQRACGLKSVCDSLMDHDVTSEKRVEILSMLRRSLETHSCAPALDLVGLIDREVTMLNRQLGMYHDYFRERIMYNYLRFLRDSQYCGCKFGHEDLCKNLESEKLREPLEPRTKLCRSCLKLLPHYRFAVHGRTTKLSTCVSCSRLCSSPVNYDPHAVLLTRIRDEETRRGCTSALAFMMHPRDIRHLACNIWHGQSVVSKLTDLYALRLIRYEPEAEWSPWNCILLTEPEAELHYRIVDHADVYSRQLRHQISLAHLIARNHFKRLAALEKDFRESSRYYAIQDRQDYKGALMMNDYYFA